MTNQYSELRPRHDDHASLHSTIELPLKSSQVATDAWHAACTRLRSLPDDQLTARVAQLNQEKSVIEAELLFYLGELDVRQLYRTFACSSLFDYLMSRLGQTEDIAYKWKWGARLVREYPLAFELISTGRLSLSVLMLLKPHLTQQNNVDWLIRAAGKSKRAVEKMLASRYPQPDMPAQIRAIPQSSPMRPPPAEIGDVPAEVQEKTSLQPVATLESSREDSSNTSLPGRASTAIGQQIPEGPTPKRKGSPSPNSCVQPLSACSYRVVFTASERLKQKIDRASELASHVIAPNDLAALFERALDRLIESEQSRRCGSGRARPAVELAARESLARSSHRSRHIPAAVRREVWQRDAGQCSYVDEQGRRCQSRHFLEFDHRQAYAMGGPSTVENVRLMCAAHNAFAAEQVFGSGRIANAIATSRLKNKSNQG